MSTANTNGSSNSTANGFKKPIAPIGQRKMSIDGYSSNIYEGKAEQMAQVAEFISKKGFLPSDLIGAEVTWFYK